MFFANADTELFGSRILSSLIDRSLGALLSPEQIRLNTNTECFHVTLISVGTFSLVVLSNNANTTTSKSSVTHQ